MVRLPTEREFRILFQTERIDPSILRRLSSEKEGFLNAPLNISVGRYALDGFPSLPKDQSGKNLESWILDDRKDLNQTKWDRARLHNASMRRTDLTGASFKNVEAQGIDLTGSTLKGADFDGAHLEGAQLRGVDLSEVKNLNRAFLCGANLEGARLTYIIQGVVKEVPHDCTESLCTTPVSQNPASSRVPVSSRPISRRQPLHMEAIGVEGQNLSGMDLRGVNFKGADLRGVDFHDADLRGADFTGANLEGARLDGADLRGAVLRRANLKGASLDSAILASHAILSKNRVSLLLIPTEWDSIPANLSFAELNIHTNLKGIQAPGVDFSLISRIDGRGEQNQRISFFQADLQGSVLPEQVLLDLSGTDLRGCDLKGKIIRHFWKLKGARLTEVELDNADLRGTTLKKADLYCASMRAVILADNSSVEIRSRDISPISVACFTADSPHSSQCSIEIVYAAADLTEANLEGANLSGARANASVDPSGCAFPVSFKDANLNRANLSHMQAGGADFSCARFDRHTIFRNSRIYSSDGFSVHILPILNIEAEPELLATNASAPADFLPPLPPLSSSFPPPPSGSYFPDETARLADLIASTEGFAAKSALSGNSADTAIDTSMLHTRDSGELAPQSSGTRALSFPKAPPRPEPSRREPATSRRPTPSDRPTLVSTREQDIS